MMRGALRLIGLVVLLALAFAVGACGGSDTVGSSASTSPSGKA